MSAGAQIGMFGERAEHFEGGLVLGVMTVGVKRVRCCQRTSWARLAEMPVISASTISRSARPGTGPGHHQMRGIPLVCMRTGEEGAGSMPVRQPLASPKLPPGAGDWRR